MERPSGVEALGGDILPPGAEPLRVDDPAMIDGHRLAGRLASGGTSVVYLARGPKGEYVVVKTTPARNADQAQARRWLHNEAACARRLPPSCTARLLVDGSGHSPPYLINEYVKGPSLGQFVEELGPRDRVQVRALALALARAISAVHGAGLIHCDLKPGNILLAADGPRVIDFSLAQEAPAPGRPAGIGTVPYSPGWVAPERLSGRPAETASDVFGWACLIGYAATGRSPFDGTAVEHEADGRRSIARAADLGALEEPVRSLVEAALAVDPAGRPTIEEIVHRLGGGEQAVAAPLPLRRPATNVPARPVSSSDAPTAPMARLRAEPAPETGAVPVRPAPGGSVPPAGRLPRRMEHTPTQALEAHAVDPAAFTAGSGGGGGAAARPGGPAAPPPRIGESHERPHSTFGPRESDGERRSRRLRTAAMVSAPTALVAVMATVIAMAATGAGPHHSEPAEPGAATSSQGPMDSPAPMVRGRRSHGPGPASPSGARDGSNPPTTGRRTGTRRTRPSSSRRPGQTHAPGSPAAPSPTPTPTRTASPSPTPTATNSPNTTTNAKTNSTGGTGSAPTSGG